jgi:tetratricopeptide (TPR) repeat protein
LKPVVQSLPQLAVVHTLQGAVDVLNGQLAAAEAAYSRALALEPTSTSALDGLVIVYVAKGDIKLAVSRAEAEVARRPEDADVLQIAAWVHQRAGNVAAAEKHLIRCIEVAPDRIKAYEALGTLYAQQNRLPDALTKFEEVSRRRPKSVPSHTMVAMLLEAQNRIDEAQRRYELVMALDQHATVAANNLAYLYIERGQKLDQALQLAQAAKAGRPDDPDINDTLGWVYYKRGLPQLARDPLEQSVKTDPKNPTYQYHLGLTLLKLGEQAGAKAALEAALKLQPDGALAGEAKQALTTM